MPMEKTFDPAAIEAKWAHEWESRGLFRPARPDATPYTIVNPPPNVTGALHIGHALDNTLQDVLVRYERLRGKDALWVVGMDHAGIATQMVVERQLEARQDKRTNYSREDFIDKVWQWKAESGGQITGQLRRLGCSMDWSREQFTMDPHFTAAVVKVFVDLHKKGLIYRDKRLVNWDPKLKTAISDLEVETHEIQGGFWHFKYPLADGVTLDDGRDYIEVATTRPETMLADMAVAVNADDARYQSVIGKFVTLPITGRRVPIVADEHADPELGSGAVKITPGHDFNDFDVGKRAGFKPGEMLNMLDGDANVIQTADGLIPAEYLGLHRFKRDGIDGARELVVARMKEAGFLIAHVDKDGVEHDAEPRTIQTPFGDRGGVVIEPWLTDQWYVDAETLAQPPMAAVRDGRINIVPKTWEKTFFNWMENIQPWCVSRQLWWGHRIPAWYGPKKAPEDATITDITWTTEDVAFVAADEKELQSQLQSYYGAEKEFVILETELEYLDWDSAVSSNADLAEANRNKIPLYRDPDVLDTWFSSALWPFATLGWPEDTDLVKRHYPNDVLISGFDILFFWDARMAMQGMEFMGDVPWKTLYLHGLVRAPDGAKMSKSKGNVVDPLGLIDQYGADALRFFMAAMESQGRDIKMDDARLAGYRNFATKLWNAARFCEANGISASTSLAAPAATLPVNRWIIGEVAATVAAMDKSLADYRFDEAANTIYSFAWDRFCDWYLELIKGAIDDETKAVAGWVLDQILVMLHPFMPFITEELWTGLGDRADYPLITAKWPEPDAVRDTEASADIDWLIKLVGELRTAKAELGLPPGARLIAHFPPSLRTRTDKLAAQLDRLARLEAVSFDPAPAGASAQLVVEGETITVPLEGVIDIAAERDRLTKTLAAATKERDGLAGRLNNPSFVERAKPEAVEKARADHAAKDAEADRLTAALARLG
ncbi:valine--tRNA ligase [Sphingopyxis sp. OPL5]|uniref:valine--tRNA ligase n=1 Tax=Sphingopyxis sp. OPL5 TaxID=2486273 RepID=UPI00164E4D88|nr:valine--tRNA ligase [Sphingopyxis sp. OPL5]QNO27496.1 valine--tRNA ligase [Sphingopyxis sp. OPL5]